MAVLYTSMTAVSDPTSIYVGGMSIIDWAVGEWVPVRGIDLADGNTVRVVAVMWDGARLHIGQAIQPPGDNYADLNPIRGGRVLIWNGTHRTFDDTSADSSMWIYTANQDGTLHVTEAVHPAEPPGYGPIAEPTYAYNGDLFILWEYANGTDGVGVPADQQMRFYKYRVAADGSVTRTGPTATGAWSTMWPPMLESNGGDSTSVAFNVVVFPWRNYMPTYPAKQTLAMNLENPQVPIICTPMAESDADGQAVWKVTGEYVGYSDLDPDTFTGAAVPGGAGFIRYSGYPTPRLVSYRWTGTDIAYDSIATPLPGPALGIAGCDEWLGSSGAFMGSGYLYREGMEDVTELYFHSQDVQWSVVTGSPYVVDAADSRHRVAFEPEPGVVLFVGYANATATKVAYYVPGFLTERPLASRRRFW
jgi:hypothetical protein